MGDKDDLISKNLYEMVGNDGIRIINSLSVPSTDLKLHEKTRIPITRVRTVLNILHKYNIVSYNSSRDEQRGWFKYTWELNKSSIDPSIRNFLISKMMKLKGEFQEINKVDFFKCENSCIRLNFIEAYDSNFRCQRCNAILRPVDSASEAKQILREIERIKSDLEIFGKMPISLKNAR